jgi:hypothetical protein
MYLCSDHSMILYDTCAIARCPIITELAIFPYSQLIRLLKSSASCLFSLHSKLHSLQSRVCLIHFVL